MTLDQLRYFIALAEWELLIKTAPKRGGGAEIAPDAA